MKKRNLHICGMLLLAFQFSQTQAAVVFTDIPDATLQVTDSLKINFDNAGAAEFTIHDYGSSGVIMPSIFFNAGYDLVTISANEFDNLRGIPANISVGPLTAWYSMGNAFVDPSWGSTLFPKNVDTYIGAKFPIGSNTYYGWICVTWDGQNLTVKSYAYNNTPNTAIVTGDKGTSTGISEVSATDVFRLSPNPASDYLQVKNLKSEPVQIKILSMTGVTVIEATLSESTTLDIRTLPAGLYFLSLSNSNNESYSQRFIKQ